MNIYFTSDNHFRHRNIIKYCNRPFSSVNEMDEVMIDNWNSVVRKGDIVFHLGDFIFGGMSVFKEYISKLNGFIKIVPGNHDYELVKKLPRVDIKSATGEFVEPLPPLYSFKLKNIPIEGNEQIIVLCHYPLLVWDRSHYGSWHLYGHVHNEPINKVKNSFNVGVDVNNFTPASIDDIINALEKGNIYE